MVRLFCAAFFVLMLNLEYGFHLSTANSIKLPVDLHNYTYYVDLYLMNASTVPATNLMRRSIIDLSTVYTVLVVDDSTFDNFEQGRTATCVHVSVDTTGASFTTRPTSDADDNDDLGCKSINASISMTATPTALIATYPTVLSTQVEAVNPELHTFEQFSQGLLGMAYSGNYALTQSDDYNDSTVAYNSFFRKALSETGSQRFGLDLRDDDDSVESSLEMGGYDNVNHNLQWYQQPTADPANHEVLADDLSLCGVSLYSNWSTTWPVLFDTSASCVTLPVEVYDVFNTWLDPSALDTDEKIDHAPPLSFTLSGLSDPLYIRLSDLLVDDGVIGTHETAPPPLPNGKRFCVVRSLEAVQQQSARQYTWPRIIFGNMALRSLYFAADFDTQSVGLAFKGNVPTETQVAAAGGCAVKATCMGAETYDKYTNTCVAPPCKDYFFVDRDPDTMECVWRSGTLGLGILAVMVIVLAEAVTFFVRTYTGAEITGQPIHPLLYSVGQQLATVVDYVVDKMEIRPQ